jgi:hypothetical protein
MTDLPCLPIMCPEGQEALRKRAVQKSQDVVRRYFHAAPVCYAAA